MANEFDEVLLDPTIVTAASGSPEFGNSMIRNQGTGVRKTNIDRYDPIETFLIDMALLDNDDRDYLARFWRGGFGSGIGFRVKLWSDYYMQDEVWAVATAGQTVVKLTKTYNRPGTTAHPQVRRIIKPVVSTNLTSGSVILYEANGITPRAIEVPFVVKLNGVVQGSGWTVHNTRGEITFASGLSAGVIVSGNCQFDTPMQFLANSFQQKLDVASEVQGMPLVEILPAQLGLT